MSNLVIIFPGIGYTVDRPLLYYGRDIAKKAGYNECIKLSYFSKVKGDFKNDPKVRKEIYKDFFKQTSMTLSEVEWKKYDNILFISKSIGTVIACNYAFENKLNNVKHILYTPLSETFKNPPNNAIAFIGTRDNFSNYKEIVDLSKRENIPITVFDDCNHSLEEKDTLKNIKIINKTMKITKEFLQDK